jgi:signal transduction histidine kinase
MLHPDDSDVFSELFASLASGKPVTTKNFRLTKDGGETYRWWQFRPNVNMNSEEHRIDMLESLSGIVIDINDTVLYNEYMTEAALVAEEITNKETFLMNISHEIRTPLNVITGFAQVIGNPSFKLSTEQRENIVNSIESNTREITNFVNELLEFSENEGQSRYSITDDIKINEFCNDLIKAAQMVNNGRLELICDSHVDDTKTIKSNSLALQRILRQLIGNGMKFTEKGSVTLSTALSDDLSQLFISVTDTGIGIPAEVQDRIFEKFYKVDSFKKGLGLGLPMAYRIAHQLGGDLQLDKEYTGGTRFVLSLPNQ